MDPAKLDRLLLEADCVRTRADVLKIQSGLARPDANPIAERRAAMTAEFKTLYDEIGAKKSDKRATLSDVLLKHRDLGARHTKLTNEWRSRFIDTPPSFKV